MDGVILLRIGFGPGIKTNNAGDSNGNSLIPADALKGAQFTAIIVPRDMNALISFGLKTTLDSYWWL